MTAIAYDALLGDSITLSVALPHSLSLIVGGHIMGASSHDTRDAEPICGALCSLVADRLLGDNATPFQCRTGRYHALGGGESNPDPWEQVRDKPRVTLT